MIKEFLRKFKRCLSLSEDGRYKHVENDASYYIERRKERLSIYFEGSNGKLDWFHNFYFPAKPYRKMEHAWFCHRGFLRVWKSIEPHIAEKILNPEITKIDIVGYSHGGAIAQLCYEYVKFNRPDVAVSGVGFGAPRVFWMTASDAVLKRFEGFIVVRNGDDLVTHLPPALLGFRHVCRVFKVGKPWSFSDFLTSVKNKGLKLALKENDHVGPVKDHYPDHYIDGINSTEEADI